MLQIPAPSGRSCTWLGRRSPEATVPRLPKEEVTEVASVLIRAVLSEMLSATRRSPRGRGHVAPVRAFTASSHPQRQTLTRGGPPMLGGVPEGVALPLVGRPPAP